LSVKPRTLLSRIHGLTLGRLRREIEPATTQDFLRFLFRWQHLHPGSQLHGAQGLSETIGQLQGFQCAASSWESDVLPMRLGRYDKTALDQLCFSGEVAWGRLACADDSPRRSPPGRSTPIAVVRREDLPWLLDATRGGTEPLGERARVLLALLEQRGALFPHELRAQSGRSGLDPRNHARLRATFPHNLSLGRYTVKWRARADDGHSEKGTFTFRVR